MQNTLEIIIVIVIVIIIIIIDIWSCKRCMMGMLSNEPIGEDISEMAEV
jgi:uncharacterized protein YneF (UPF0154 family)